MKKRIGNLCVGSKVNSLTIVGIVQRGAKQEWHWICSCDCGSSKEVYVRNSALFRGVVRSCGCYANERRNTSGLGSGFRGVCASCGSEFNRKSHKQDVCSVQCRFNHYKNSGADDVCWEWSGPKNENGYGVIFLDTNKYSGRRNTTTAHRYSYALHHGDIPAGMCVMHRCDNPSCVNPSHLSLGTSADNNRDRSQKGRNGLRIFGEHDRAVIGEKVRGAKNPYAKLTEDQARDIKYSTTTHRAALAERYNVSIATVKSIRAGRNWGHI